ncbi:MAG: hypothetical protein CMN85_10980 [Spongiibacteraceae bacterium]|uniref:hypothetical protein n=1 Tax=uncultured Haliea sp. TaxID=622616 RepID=UPI000C56005C|nr:hypothetical protein [Spongiibacteraceae bacterium]|tara:strand:+ start:8472 stop:8864 length:393 start_codon:yes stop_codon:yes gene_type:complete
MANAQHELFHEDLSDALKHLVAALGGPKIVGVELWPTLAPDTAGRKINHCLNDEHAQQFHPQDIMWLLTEGRRRGVHSAMAYITREVGYADPQPVEPEDEQAKLQREFCEAAKNLDQIMVRIERIQGRQK